MGVEYSTHCGPYIECKVGKITGTTPRWHCSNVVCQRNTDRNWDRSAKFCPECGNAIEQVNLAVAVESVDMFELQEDLADSLAECYFHTPAALEQKGIHIWVGARDEPEDGQPSRECLFCEDKQSLTELRPGAIEAEIAQFARNYAQELDRLRAEYGSSNVTVKWGILESVHY